MRNEARISPRQMNHKSIIRIVLEPLAIAIVAALALRTTISAFSIPSASMFPALLPGDHILVTPYDGPFWHHTPARGDVVVFRRGTEMMVKRIIALPGESIEVRDRDVFLGDKLLGEPYLREAVDNGAVPATRLAGDAYFVMGDNRQQSLDSRVWGPLEGSSIVGHARLVFWSTAGGATEGAMASASTPSTAPAVIAAPRIRWNRVLRIVR
jgi:signal peptidase I